MDGSLSILACKDLSIQEIEWLSPALLREPRHRRLNRHGCPNHAYSRGSPLRMKQTGSEEHHGFHSSRHCSKTLLKREVGGADRKNRIRRRATTVSGGWTTVRGVNSGKNAFSILGGEVAEPSGQV